MNGKLKDQGESARLLAGFLWGMKRRRVAAAAVLASDVSLIFSIAAAVFFSALSALSAAAFLFVATFFAALVVKPRAPDLRVAARRLDSRFPRDAGVASAALDNEDASALSRYVSERARRLLTSLGAFSRLEIDDVLLGIPIDPERLRRRAAFQRTLCVAAPWLAACFAVAIASDALAEYRARESSVATSGVALVDGDSEAKTSEKDERNEKTPDASSEADAERGTTAASDPEADDPERTLEALGTLVADLERAAALAKNFGEELRRDDESDVELAIELARELDEGIESSTGLIARAATVAERAAVALRSDAKATAVRGFLTSRRARELLAYFQAGRARRGELTRALSETLRGAPDDRALALGNARNLADALAERLDAESRAFALLDASWRAGNALAEASTLEETASRESARALTSRAGASPSAGTRNACATFFETLERADQSLTSTASDVETLATRLADPSGAEFVAFARRVAADARLEAVFFPETSESVEDYVARTSRVLASARKEGLVERWGRATTLLGALPLSVLRDAETRRERSETIKLAESLVLGVVGEETRAFDAASFKTPGAESFEPTADEGDETEFSGTRQEDASTTRRALDREARLSESASRAERAATQDRLVERSARGDASGGATSDRGDVFDPEFAGGGATAENGATLRNFLGDDFIAELPQDERARVERAQKWAPSDEYLRRAETFRRNLWKTFGAARGE